MKKRIPSRNVVLINKITGELWLCENYSVRRKVDNNQFVEVYKADNPRRMWINADTLSIVGKQT